MRTQTRYLRASAMLALAVAAALGAFAATKDAPLPRPNEGSGKKLDFETEVTAFSLSGLDLPLRGGGLRLGARIGLGIIGPSLANGALGLRAGAVWDGAFNAPIVEGELVLGFGPDLVLFAGCELPLSSLQAQGRGQTIGLDAADWPNRFGISAILAEFSAASSGAASAGAASAGAAASGGFRLCLEAELSWSAYRSLGSAIASESGGSAQTENKGASQTAASAAAASAKAAAASGLGFSAGFKARLGFRISWSPPRGRSSLDGRVGKASAPGGASD